MQGPLLRLDASEQVWVGSHSAGSISKCSGWVSGSGRGQQWGWGKGGLPKEAGGLCTSSSCHPWVWTKVLGVEGVCKGLRARACPAISFPSLTQLPPRSPSQGRRGFLPLRWGCQPPRPPSWNAQLRITEYAVGPFPGDLGAPEPSPFLSTPSPGWPFVHVTTCTALNALAQSPGPHPAVGLTQGLPLSALWLFHRVLSCMSLPGPLDHCPRCPSQVPPGPPGPEETAYP